MRSAAISWHRASVLLSTPANMFKLHKNVLQFCSLRFPYFCSHVFHTFCLVLKVSLFLSWGFFPISVLRFFPTSVLRTFFGAPLSRRRIFLVMIRKDCLRDLGMSLDDYIVEKLRGMNQPIQHTWSLGQYTQDWLLHVLNGFDQNSLFFVIFSCIRQELLLPSDHPAVKKDCRAKEGKRVNNSSKWLGVISMGNWLPKVPL